jgi:hypothetical protein
MTLWVSKLGECWNSDTNFEYAVEDFYSESNPGFRVQTVKK